MIINPKSELFKWGPIEFKLLYEACFMEVVLRDIKKYYPWPWPASIVIYQQGRGLWINELDKLQSVGLKYFNKYIADKQEHKKHWSKYQAWIKKFKSYSKNVDSINISDLSRQELSRLLKRFYQLNIEFWVTVHVPELANWGGEYLLKKELEKIDAHSSDKYLEILSAPIKYSFFQQEELDLLEVGKLTDKNDFENALLEHTNKYHWILNSYGGNQVLTADFFRKKLNDLAKDKKSKDIIQHIKNSIIRNKRRKKELAKKLKLSKNIINIAEHLSQSIWWQDHRKAYIWQMNYYWDIFIREISKRTDYEFKDLQWCWGSELLTLLMNPEKIRKQDIISRQNYYLLLGDKGKLKKISDNKIIQKYIQTFWPEDKIETKELKGTVVSQGKSKVVSGHVRIIRNPLEEIEKMKEGDVLVASMTSPEYIVAMRKASAIITDEGGMTSHAAIVSRELGIPCIVGTKVVTRAFIDGDRVEVDADRGIVRKIK